MDLFVVEFDLPLVAVELFLLFGGYSAVGGNADLPVFTLMLFLWVDRCRYYSNYLGLFQPLTPFR